MQTRDVVMEHFANLRGAAMWAASSLKERQHGCAECWQAAISKGCMFMFLKHREGPHNLDMDPD